MRKLNELGRTHHAFSHYFDPTFVHLCALFMTARICGWVQSVKYADLECNYYFLAHKRLRTCRAGYTQRVLVAECCKETCETWPTYFEPPPFLRCATETLRFELPRVLSSRTAQEARKTTPVNHEKNHKNRLSLTTPKTGFLWFRNNTVISFYFLNSFSSALQNFVVAPFYNLKHFLRFVFTL